MSGNIINQRTKFIKVKSKKIRKNSSRIWLQRHLSDPYVQQSKLDGYRSRAAYKLIEIHNKFKIFRPNTTIIDLGAAPGSWSQAINDLVKNVQIIAVDRLHVEPINNTSIICGDFLEEETLNKIYSQTNNKLVDVVISDMASNTTGHNDTDHIRTLYLFEEALKFALNILKVNGHFISKIFAGGADHEILKEIKKQFETVKHFKPSSSRKESKEFYLVALNRKQQQKF